MMNDDAGRHPRELLSPYLDGELGPDERARVTAHLEQCAECGALLDDLRTLVAGIAAEEPPSPPADLAARIGRGVGELDGEAKVIPIRRPLWHSPLVLSSMAAVMAGIIVTVVWLSSRPAAVRQEFGVIAEKEISPPPEAGRIPMSSAKGEAPSSIGKQERKKVRADAPAKRAPVPLPQSAQETMALMEEKAARAARPKAAPSPPAAPPPAEPPPASGKEQAGAGEFRVAADVAELDALGYVADDHGEGAAPGGPPVAEPPPARSLELQKSDYRAVLSEAGALTFRSGSYECVIPVISPARGNVPPSSRVDLTTEIRQIFELATDEQSRRAAVVSEDEAESLGARRDVAASEEPRLESALQYARSASPEVLILRDANEMLLYRAAVLSDQDRGAVSSAAPIAARLDRLIREHYLSLMERGCGPLPPELQEGE
jgi:anti-sigma factor RsiW